MLKSPTEVERKEEPFVATLSPAMAVAITITCLITMFLAGPAMADENPFEGFYWVRGLDVPAYYWTTDGDKLAGPRWEGGLFVCPLILDNRVFYRDSEYCEWHFIEKGALVSDPRQTDWWEKSRLNCRARTLWGRVADATRSQDWPIVTKLVIEDMVHCKVVTQKEVDGGKMTSKRLSEVMLKYSEQVWD